MLQTSERLDPSLLEQVRTAESELYRVARIARQTLTFYRETNRPLETDLAELLNSLFSMFGQRFEGPVKMRKHFEPVQRVLAYTSQLRQVFSNLIVNAMEAMSTAGGTLAVYLHPSHHWSNPSVQGVRITISDTGPGILIEDKRRIFEAFFTTKDEKGTGLGLRVTHNIILRHGGTIHVLSGTRPERHGTVFSVFLPYRPNFD